nr:PREDICTED: olfactory receptor 52A1-like [Latimeria chalumnae]|eukprot:XP_014348051.1 PREDICTED: olfactory receptor 52A1-like [Latimeria chalumnae]
MANGMSRMIEFYLDCDLILEGFTFLHKVVVSYCMQAVAKQHIYKPVNPYQTQGFPVFNLPVNLAFMALERYIAICNLLQHTEICTLQRTCKAVAVIWLLGIIPSTTNLITTIVVQPASYFKKYIYCTREAFQTAAFQIWVIVIYTYFKIVLEARKAAADKESALKACKTVILHVVQLIFSMGFFLFPVIEYLFMWVTLYIMFHIRFVNYFITMLLPKFLSPLIYGVRDENFKKHLKHYFLCMQYCVQPINRNNF